MRLACLVLLAFGWGCNGDKDAVDSDADGDGVPYVDDCDDGDAQVGAQTVWYNDADGDGFGNAEAGTWACSEPAGAVADSADCDDSEPSINPQGTEVCGGGDEDCDGLEDEADDGLDLSTRSDWYADADGDGYGDAANLSVACEAPIGAADNGEDCDDADASTWPGAGEVCGDGIVNDCDGDEPSAMAACGLGGTVALAEADLKFTGEAAGDGAGRSVSGLGDVDGDGLGELVVSADSESSAGVYAGAVYLLTGASLGAASGTRSLSGADVKFTGEAAGDYAGSSVSGGDLDGDGVNDLIIGAYGEDGGGADAGAAYVLAGGGSLAGASGEISLSGADLKLTGEAAGDIVGGSVSGTADVDGDGLDDLVIGGYRDDTGGMDAGAAYVLLGGSLAGESDAMSLSGADLKLTGEAANDALGISVSGVGDVDGDGLDELIVGAQYEQSSDSYAGAAYLLLGGGALDGASGSMGLSDADLKLTGEDAYNFAGRSVSSAGDVDDDGLGDLIIGAYGEGSVASYSGAAYLLLGGSLVGESGTRSLAGADLKLTGEAAADYAGGSVSYAGDVDGDGLGDVLVGADGSVSGGTYAGTAYLLLGGGSLAAASGTRSLSSADLELTGENAADRAGFSVAGAPDIDGDGFDDLLVAAFSDDIGGSGSGAAYLLRGGGY